jgi:hypothetical protein
MVVAWRAPTVVDDVLVGVAAVPVRVTVGVVVVRGRLTPLGLGGAAAHPTLEPSALHAAVTDCADSTLQAGALHAASDSL